MRTSHLLVLAALFVSSSVAADPLDRLLDRSFDALASKKPAYVGPRPDLKIVPFEGIKHATPAKVAPKDKYYEVTLDLALPPLACYSVMAVAKKGTALAIDVGGQILPRQSDHADQQADWDYDVALHGNEVTWVKWCQTPANGRVRVKMWSTTASPVAYRLFANPMSPAEKAVVRDGVDRCMKRAGSTAEYCESVSWCPPSSDFDRCKPIENNTVGDLIAEARQDEADAKRAEGEAKKTAATEKRYLGYDLAASFASGDCRLNDCIQYGWVTNVPGGQAETTCNVSNCVKNGWTTRFPDGSQVETTCGSGNCFDGGWTTTHPDGTTTTTSCTFTHCMKEGWSTKLPDGSELTTTCDSDGCLTNGWETQLPSGTSMTCTCTFHECLTHGASCK